MILLPIRSIGNRTGYKNTQSFPVKFSLSENSFLHHITIIIPVNNIPYFQLLIYPIRIIGIGIIVRTHLSPVTIDKEISSVKVYQFIGVRTIIIAEINTPVNIKIFSDRSGISRHQSVPVMLVYRIRHRHQRTIFTGCIQLINLIVSKSSVGITKISIQRPVAGTIPLIRIIGSTS